MIGRRATIAWYSLAALIGLVLWVECCGRIYVEGFPLEVLEELCAVRGLTPVEGSALYRILALSPLDGALTVSLFCGLVMVAAYALLWLTGRKVWENPVSPTVACALLFLGAETFWIQADSPSTSLGVLVFSFAVASLIAGKLPLLGLAAVLSLAFEPAYGLTFSLLLLYLSRLRREAYGAVVTGATAFVGTASVLFSIYYFGLSPSLSGWSIWTLLPISGLALCKELRESRLGLYSALLGASFVAGAPEVAAAVCLGDLAVVGLRERDVVYPAQGAGYYATVARNTLVVWIAFALTLAASLKGEKELNRTILIPAQKSKVSISNLFLPFSLSTHAELVGANRWNGKRPYPELGLQEVEACRELSGPFRVLTLDHIAEQRDLSLLMALLSKKPLRGWSTQARLSTSSLTCKAAGANVVVGETVILRGWGELEITEGPALPTDLSKLAPLDLLTLWSLPFRAQDLSESKNSGYRLVESGATETLYFSKRGAKIAFSASPEHYKIIDLKNSRNSREIDIHSFELSLQCPSLDAPLPSRSLVELEFILTNTGSGPITYRELESVTLGVVEGESFSPFEQPWPGKIVLFPKESMPVKLYLATPEREDRFRLRGSFKTVDGAVSDLRIVGPVEFKSWRRLPAVGTWIEKP